MKLLVVLTLSLLIASASVLPTATAEVGCGDGSTVNRVQYCANEGIDLVQEIFCDLACPTLLP